MSFYLLKHARLSRNRDVLIFIAAVILLLMFLSAFAPAIAQVINPPPPSAGGTGDMLASVWANGSADGNPNVVDNARYAGSAGSAFSADYAGNSAQWNGFDMPGDSGFTSYIAFLAHNEWGQLTWIQADSWRGPQGDQGPPGEMSAYTWANGSGSGNPNVMDHAAYSDSAGSVDHASSADSAGWADSAGYVDSAGNAMSWASHDWPTDAAGALMNDGSGNVSWTAVSGNQFAGPDEYSRVYLSPGTWLGFMNGPNGFWSGGMYASGTDFIVGYNPVDAPNIVFKNEHSDTPGLDLNCGYGGVRVSGTTVFTAEGQLTIAALAQIQGYDSGSTQVLKHDDAGTLFWTTQ